MATRQTQKNFENFDGNEGSVIIFSGNEGILAMQHVFIQNFCYYLIILFYILSKRVYYFLHKYSFIYVACETIKKQCIVRTIAIIT